MDNKFTDRFFAFPIKIYDGKTVRFKENDEEFEEEREGEALPILDGDWVMGQVRVSRHEVDNLLWYDGYTGDLNVKDVAEKGFNSTVVMTENFGQFSCMWPRDKFERKLNEFVAYYDLLENKDEIATTGFNKTLEERMNAERRTNPPMKLDGSLVEKKGEDSSLSKEEK